MTKSMLNVSGWQNLRSSTITIAYTAFCCGVLELFSSLIRLAHSVSFPCLKRREREFLRSFLVGYDLHAHNVHGVAVVLSMPVTSPPLVRPDSIDTLRNVPTRAIASV
ncbi:hypothetical protein EJ03DRAFT_220239 [Teratosphaeria nubilosa]|uniref:Uncharacterized protein n=1 Tax=Teratosphaeria nubilosa TaxID=161662 RepID=A0A6G1KWT1_9PEZI|nr:hypothetical protein EJ03DRAFT_220239 [Teratosphaeria nubilosa]